MDLLEKLAELIGDAYDERPSASGLVQNCTLDTVGMDAPVPLPFETEEKCDPFANVRRFVIRGVDISVRGNTLLIRPKATDGVKTA